MKKTITLLTIFLSIISINAQEDEIKLLTYANTQDINFLISYL